MVPFSNKILVIGYGAVAECTLPILFRHLDVPPQNVTVVEFQDCGAKSAPWAAKGVRFLRERITREDMAAQLGRLLAPGDLLLDLAWNIETAALLQWCHDHGVLYLNASVELWDPYEGASGKPPTERTLYWRHMQLRRLVSDWDRKGPTALVEHGANPGLISHFTKQGLVDIGQSLIAENKLVGEEAEKVLSLIREGAFNRLAQALGVRVIHCSERDTQISSQPKRVDEFVNTWSVEGFREEGTTTAELGWGTHERWLPPTAHRHVDGPRNQICLAQMGMNTWVRSWVPDYSIRGMVVRHGEAFTISDKLTVWQDGQAVYRPTVHYAYCPCDAAIASLNELRGYDYRLVERQRIMSDDIVEGSDILGALLMGHAHKSWWTGSALSIEECRKLAPHQNATTMQVAIAVVAGALWMIRNPERGFCVPDDVPHDFVLPIAKPFLGRFISRPSDWTPLRDYHNAFGSAVSSDKDWEDPWQFKNFLVREGQ
jgi:homospermidine synthase